MLLAIDLYCGLFGWGGVFASEGYRVVGYDLEDMCGKFGIKRPEGCELVLQDVLTLHGSQFKDATCIVASPPCQAYSYRAMPWKRAKALPPPSNELFDACFRIQREACEAAGRYIPMVVENVRGAQPWVGRAKWHYGSFYLWGDVPALMPIGNAVKMADVSTVTHLYEKTGKHCGNWTTLAARSAGIKQQLSGPAWFDHGIAGLSSRGFNRKAASAMIAKIPFELARYIAATWKPLPERGS